MIKIYQQVSGNAISENAGEMHCDQMLSSDMFLVSTPALPYRPSDCQSTVSNILKSAKSFYGALSSQLYDQFAESLGIKRMAWENENEYSQNKHVHNYSKVEIIPLIPQTYPGVSSLVDFTVDSRKYTVNMPSVTTYKVPSPYIGQLMFLAVDNFPPRPNEDMFYSSQDFDGWVYADGRCLKKASFPAAYDYFGDAYGQGCAEDEFSIPDFRRFVNMTSNFKSEEQMSNHIAETTVLRSHKHDISNPAINGTATLSAQFYAVNNTNPGSACHGSAGTVYNQHQNYDCYMNIGSVTCTESNIKNAEDTRSAYPNHTFIPVLIYIGKYGA